MIKLTSLLKEKIENNKVICNECNWSWELKEGGDNKYVCHKCGHDNNPIKEVEVTQGHENDRDMVVGVAEILRMVDDVNNRTEIADSMLRKFKSEGVIHNVKEFLTMCGLEYVTEKWSAKYKKSINCSNPKGFSQKAHCAGKAKKESVNEDVSYGYKHIIHLIPTGYAPNNPKYKKDLADLRDVLNKFYDTHGYDVKIRNTF